VDRNALDEVGFLDRLDDTDADALLRLARRRSYGPGTTLFLEGDDGFTVLLVIGGRVKVSVSAPNGHDVVIDVLGPGSIVGELSAIDGGPRSATATTLAQTEIAHIRHEDFVTFLAGNARVSNELMRSLVGRVRGATRRQLEFGSSDALSRTCGRIIELAGSSTTVHLPVSQTDLASWLGLSREAVVKALRTLRDLGWIASRGRVITLLDVEAIRRRANT
jgi:CRP/FNR family transcriptional regulator, cyclic AMP receptor protein